MDISLYSYWRSSSAWRVRIILALKELDYNYIAVNLLQKSNLAPEYLEKNPSGQVPTLVTADINLTQSLAIIQYLEAKHPQINVMPKSPEDLGKMWEICEIINSGIQPLQNLPILELVEKFGTPRKDWAQSVIAEGFESVEKILEKTAGTYCIGENVTVADACLVPQIYNANRFELDLSRFPLITAIGQRLSALPAFQKSHPDAQPDFMPGK